VSWKQYACISGRIAVQATVGAGLPILATLKHLKETGDRIISVEGIFSGTLSYLFNTFGEDDRSFSEIVKQAKQAGFTEPDPRDDLSGMDVARKVRPPPRVSLSCC
jgi:bifunctional aspartokinase / homoserine dehydrogenase 1